MVQRDILSSADGDIVIQPINHASLVLGFGDTWIYLDPVGNPALYQGLPAPDLILLTHEHQDHFNADTIAALLTPQTSIIGAKVVIDLLEGELAERAEIIAQGESTDFEGVEIEALPAHNTHPDRLKFHPPGIGNGYVLGFADKRVYVSGDTEVTPEMQGLSDIDVAFLPMDGHYTMDGAAAAEGAKAFRPKVVYPFHYGQGGQPPVFAELLAGEADIEVRLRDWYEA